MSWTGIVKVTGEFTCYVPFCPDGIQAEDRNEALRKASDSVEEGLGLPWDGTFDEVAAEVLTAEVFEDNT